MKVLLNHSVDKMMSTPGYWTPSGDHHYTLLLTHPPDAQILATFRAFGTLSALVLLHLETLPILITPAVWEAMIHGVHSLDDLKWLPSFNEAASKVLDSWPSDPSQNVDTNATTREIAEIFGKQVLLISFFFFFLVSEPKLMIFHSLLISTTKTPIQLHVDTLYDSRLLNTMSLDCPPLANTLTLMSLLKLFAMALISNSIQKPTCSIYLDLTPRSSCSRWIHSTHKKAQTYTMTDISNSGPRHPQDYLPSSRTSLTGSSNILMEVATLNTLIWSSSFPLKR